MSKKTVSKKKTTKSVSKKKSVPKKTKTTKTKKTLAKVSSKKTKLIKDIQLLLKELNENDLAFVLNQCGAMYNNQKIRDSINDKSQNKNSKLKQGTNKTAKPEVKIREADDGSYFIVEINNYSNFFTLNEMRKFVRICHASDDEVDASNRIFKWFSTERQDVKRNSLLSGPTDSSLQEIYKIIIKTYDVKE